MPQQCDQQFRVLSFLLLYFFNLSFFLFFSFLSPFSWNAFSCYIPRSLHNSHRTHVSQASVATPCPISHLLEPSTISCKAACLLLRHPLHINAARGLVGKHLMRRQQLLQIFVIPHPHPLSNIYPSPCCETPLICYIKELGMLLATSDRGSEMIILLGYG